MSRAHRTRRIPVERATRQAKTYLSEAQESAMVRLMRRRRVTETAGFLRLLLEEEADRLGESWPAWDALEPEERAAS